MDATFIMNFLAPLLLGVAIGALLWRTRRTDWNQRAKTEKKTEDLYARTEDARIATEGETDENEARRRRRA
jgi:uncharacterized membrane-anchored protein YhcB (DUF1043 family)